MCLNVATSTATAALTTNMMPHPILGRDLDSTISLLHNTKLSGKQGSSRFCCQRASS
jgi:hypothetical protein